MVNLKKKTSKQCGKIWKEDMKKKKSDSLLGKYTVQIRRK